MSLKLLAFGVALSLGVVANADILFNNFGAGDTYNTGIDYTIDSTQSVANPFSVVGNYTLSSVTVANNISTNFILSIATGGATTPGPDLVTWSYTGTGVQSFTPGSTVALTTGDYYVVIRQAVGTGGFGGWAWNSTGDSGPFSFTNPANTWNATSGTRSVYRVEAAPVPEPASLFALGSLVVVAVRRRRKA